VRVKRVDFELGLIELARDGQRHKISR
jgi:hypothetical protein